MWGHSLKGVGSGSLLRFIGSIHGFDSYIRSMYSIRAFDSWIRVIDSIHWFDSMVRSIDSIPWFDSLIRLMDSIRKRKRIFQCFKLKIKTKIAKPVVLLLQMFGKIYGTSFFAFSSTPEQQPPRPQGSCSLRPPAGLCRFLCQPSRNSNVKPREETSVREDIKY